MDARAESASADSDRVKIPKAGRIRGRVARISNNVW
jgi:hypothetical protein